MSKHLHHSCLTHLSFRSYPRFHTSHVQICISLMSTLPYRSVYTFIPLTSTIFYHSCPNFDITFVLYISHYSHKDIAHVHTFISVHTFNVVMSTLSQCSCPHYDSAHVHTMTVLMSTLSQRSCPHYHSAHVHLSQRSCPHYHSAHVHTITVLMSTL